MTEIKKTLTILKNRWPEVSLIVGLNVLYSLSNKLISTTNAGSKHSYNWVAFIYSIFLLIFITALIAGFERTVYLEGDKRQRPIVLLRTGLCFLWRKIKLAILIMPIFIIFAWLTYLIIKMFAPTDITFFKTYEVSPLLYMLYYAIPELILIKPLLLIPALIIVLDCQVLESFKYLKKCKLLDAKGLVFLFMLSIVLGFIWTSLPWTKTIKTIHQYTLWACYAVLKQFVVLLIAVTAVRFVASLGLVYDKPRKKLNSKGLLKKPIKD